MSKVLQKLEFSVSSLGQDRCAEGLHDLLHGDSLVGQLVFGRAIGGLSEQSIGDSIIQLYIPDEAESTHADGLQVSVSNSRQLPHPHPSFETSFTCL